MIQQADNDRLKEALGHYKAGRLDKARAVYLAMLSQQPELVEAMQMLGIIAYQTKEYDRAIGYFQQVISIKPDWPETYNNLGASFWEQGKIEQAIAAYKQAIAVKPDYPDAYNNLAWALEKQGKRLEAIELRARYANETDQRGGSSHQSGATPEKLAAMLKKEKRYQEALAHYQQEIACYEKEQTRGIDPKCADAYYNAAKIMEEQNRREEAIAYYEKAIAIKPEAKFYNQLGKCYLRCEKLAEAARQYEQAIALKPNYLDAICDLGVILQKQGKIAEAIGQYRQALAIKPDDPEAYNRMGTAWGKQGKLAEAIACHQKAIALKPDLAEAYNNLGAVLQEQLKLQEAIGYYRHAIALKPDGITFHVNLGECLLLLQDFQQGCIEGEWRWRMEPQTLGSRSGPTPGRLERLGKPLWDGSPLAGKTILLQTERWGYGDVIQFIRYAPLVAQRGAGKVILETYPALRRLLTKVSGVQEVVVKGEPLPAFDVQVPLMNLPRILGTTIETIPARIPYLYAEEKHAEGAVKYSGALRTARHPDGIVKVGIMWASDPTRPTARKRSCPVSLFLELSQIPGISLYSLQKEHTDILDGTPIQDLSTHLNDFADTAAVISQLDLVISVDTSVAHLAGALGKPVWVLLPFSPDWRWFLDRSDSPWYPTMRLFRQAKPGDWPSVFAQVKAALTAHPVHPGISLGRHV
ncbi:MAG: tetratricopeptide repeat protein [Hormoscilla sp. GUM202]|nr:tetratricopeptide repeat protein [Hormoscilla sp. GUM202]